MTSKRRVYVEPKCKPHSPICGRRNQRGERVLSAADHLMAGAVTLHASDGVPVVGGG